MFHVPDRKLCEYMKLQSGKLSEPHTTESHRDFGVYVSLCRIDGYSSNPNTKVYGYVSTFVFGIS